MKVVYQPRFTVKMNGVEYTVGLASADVFEGVCKDKKKTAEGFTDAHRALILISESTPEQRRPLVFWHEWVHAAFGELGADFLAQMLGCEESYADAAEEYLATYLGPRLAEALDSKRIFNALKGPAK